MADLLIDQTEIVTIVESPSTALIRTIFCTGTVAIVESLTIGELTRFINRTETVTIRESTPSLSLVAATVSGSVALGISVSGSPASVSPGITAITGSVNLEIEAIGEIRDVIPGIVAIIGQVVLTISIPHTAASTKPAVTAVIGLVALKIQPVGTIQGVAAVGPPAAVAPTVTGSVAVRVDLTGVITPAIPSITAIVGSVKVKVGWFRAIPGTVVFPSIPASSAVVGSVNLEVDASGQVVIPRVPVLEVSAGAVLEVKIVGIITFITPQILEMIGAVQVTVEEGVEDDIYETWVLSGSAFEPSIFTGFNFNSFAQHQGQTFAAGEDGIYLLGGDSDDGELIHSGVRIGPINFGIDKDKRIRSIQFGSGGKDTRVWVKSENGEGVFTPERDDNRVVVSREIQGREFIVDVIDFEELSQFEATPLKLARR